MATFAELLDTLRNPGENGPAETIYDDLTAAYNDLESGGLAKVAELTEALALKDSEISRLKSMNYDLLMSSADSDNNSESSGDQVDSADDDTPPTIDDLFE